MFVFRIFSSVNSGLGHIARMHVLANKLEENGQKTCFILDQTSPQLDLFLTGRLTFRLDLSENTSEIEDAQAVLSLLHFKNISPIWMIVDHYGLGKVWEQHIQSAGLKVLAIDDLVRKHSANAVVDFRWRGKDVLQRYRPVVSEACDLLLGPRFLLLQQPEIFPIDPKTNNEFRLLIGLGGGGDGLFLKSMIESVLERFVESKTPLHLKVILGPLLSDVNALLNWSLKLPDFIKIDWLQSKTDLSYEYQWCDFYLGAAGGTLYQIRALQKPALFFSIAQNQDNDQRLLDDIGQYFFLDQLDDSQLPDLASFMNTIAKQLSRIQTLFASANITIDYQGGNRIVDYLLNGTLPNISDSYSGEHLSWQNLANDYQIRSVEDSDINHYLDSRNHPFNRQNMLDTKEIPKLSHYHWWLNTQRRSFLLAKEGEEKLYIWDQLKSFEGEEYLIGGWFVCHENTVHTDAMMALDWQLKVCDQDYPNATWIAVIHRQNRYVKLMNDYLGFKEIPEDSDYKKVVSEFFSSASKDEFFYVYK